MVYKNIPARFAIFIYFFLWLSVFASQPAWAGTALEDLAASMKPGTWAELKTNNINPTLTNTGGSSGFVFGYAEEVRWDPVTRKLYYIGMDHGQGQLRFLAYSEANNTWSIIAEPPPNMNCATYPPQGCTPNHGYDHAALDPVGRHFYWRYGYADKKIHRYHLDNQTWEVLPPNNLMQYVQCCGAIEYFPEMGGLIWVQGQSGAKTQGGVYLFNPSTSNWSALGATNTTGYPMDGTFNNFAEYNPVHKIMIFGGGDNGQGIQTRILYKLTNAGTITALNNAPFYLGTQHGSKVTVDPVTGDFLVFNSAHQFWKYNVLTDTWTQLADPPSGIWPPFPTKRVHGMVVGYIDTYGVITTVSCAGGSPGSCRIFLYKHGSGGNPLPSDTVAPSIPTALGTNVVSASQINLSWTASTDNVGVAGYRIFRNGVQIATTSSATYQNTGLSPSTSYTYSVAAYDTAGNNSAQSSGVSATTLATPPPSTGSLTFVQKCAQSGVVNCYPFDDQATLFYFDGGSPGSALSGACATLGKNSFFGGPTRPGPGNAQVRDYGFGECVAPMIDTTTKHSGAGSLKIKIPAHQNQNAPQFTEPFRRPDFPYFAPGSSLGDTAWIQFYFKVDAPYLDNNYFCSQSCAIKIAIFHGDPGPGSTSCCKFMSVVDWYNIGTPSTYTHGATGSIESHGEPQTVRGCVWSKLDPAFTKNPSLYTEPPCVKMRANLWHEATFQIILGGRAGAYDAASTVRMWIDGQKIVDVNNARLGWGTEEGKGLGSFVFLTQMTGQQSAPAMPEANIWYDSLVISAQPIAMSTSSSTAKPPKAPSNTQLRAQ